jgi:hypothetical protein
MLLYCMHIKLVEIIILHVQTFEIIIQNPIKKKPTNKQTNKQTKKKKTTKKQRLALTSCDLPACNASCECFLQYSSYPHHSGTTKKSFYCLGLN